MSHKREQQNLLYRKLRQEYLADHEKCECCKVRPANQVHHKRGRWGDRLNEVAYFLAVCSMCHDEIHHYPQWAYGKGYLIQR